MKLSFVAFAVLSIAAASTDASCTSSDGPCQEGAGDCTRAVRAALGGDVVAARTGDIYGKYCGGGNYCQVVDSISSSGNEDEDMMDEANICEKPGDRRRLGRGKKGKNGDKSNKGSKQGGKEGGKKGSAEDGEPCPAEPCDTIDLACFHHDACLGNEILINPPPEGEGVPVPQRCNCDVNLVYDAVLVQASTAPTGLCDAAFYNDPISDQLPITSLDLLQHEAILIAGGFCCTLLHDSDGNGIKDCGEDPNTDQAKFAVALLFCEEFVGGLAASGILLC